MRQLYSIAELPWAQIAIAKTAPKGNYARRAGEAVVFPFPAYSGYTGVSFHETSHIRSASVYFDDETIAYPLTSKEVLRRQFRTFRIEPLYDGNALGAEVLPANAGTGAGQNINPQIARVRLWMADPLGCINTDAWLQIGQVDITCSGVVAANQRLFHFYAPTATAVRIVAGNGNNINAGAIPLLYSRVSPIYPPDGFPTVFDRVETDAQLILPGAAQNLPAPADANNWPISWIDQNPSIEGVVSLGGATAANDRIRIAAYARFAVAY
jgi:hypothetical protein